jgi:hypothetical protein
MMWEVVKFLSGFKQVLIFSFAFVQIYGFPAASNFHLPLQVLFIIQVLLPPMLSLFRPFLP